MKTCRPGAVEEVSHRAFGQALIEHVHGGARRGDRGPVSKYVPSHLWRHAHRALCSRECQHACAHNATPFCFPFFSSCLPVSLLAACGSESCAAGQVRAAAVSDAW